MCSVRYVLVYSAALIYSIIINSRVRHCHTHKNSSGFESSLGHHPDFLHHVYTQASTHGQGLVLRLSPKKKARHQHNRNTFAKQVADESHAVTRVNKDIRCLLQLYNSTSRSIKAPLQAKTNSWCFVKFGVPED